LQGGDCRTPHDRENPYCPSFTNTLFEADLGEVDQRWANEVKYVCRRFLHSQAYRSMAVALGYTGRGVQVTWAKPVLAFVRGAYPVDTGVPAGTDVPAMSAEEIAAWKSEGNPTEEQVDAWVTVLRRVCV